MKILLAGVVVAGLLALGPAAHAEDQRPCVSKAEFRGVSLIGNVTRSTLETRWEVQTVGSDEGYAIGDGVAVPAFDYKACGYGLDEVIVTIVLQPSASSRVKPGDLKVIAVSRWRGIGATPHGRP